MGYLRAFARAMLIFQDLGQLEGTYPRARSVIANAATPVAVGVNDMETARMLSDRIGQTTVAAKNEGISQRTTQVMAAQAQNGLAEAGQSLLDASEILRLGADEVLVFLRRRVPAPIRAARLAYHREARFNGLYDGWRSAGATGPGPAPAIAHSHGLPASGSHTAGATPGPHGLSPAARPWSGLAAGDAAFLPVSGALLAVAKDVHAPAAG